MPVALSPVSPSVLRWLIDEDGRSALEIAEAVDVSIEVVDQWLEGDQLPTRGQVTKLASALNRPRAVLLLPRPPAQTMPSAFRNALGAGNSVTRQARTRVRESRTIQRSMAWIRREEPDVDMPNATYSDSAIETADLVRDWLGREFTIHRGRRYPWASERDALNDWRSLFESHGILVFMLQIGQGEIRGFSDWDRKAPMVGVNTSGFDTPVKLFTMAHELGHLVCRSDSSCADLSTFRVSQSGIENWCETFASALLMPASEMRKLAKANNFERDHIGLADVKIVQSHFRVSGRAAAMALHRCGYASSDLYARVANAFKPRPRSGSPRSQPRPKARLGQYGPDVVGSLLTELPHRDALRVLRIDAQDARVIADELPGIDGF